MRNFLFSVLFFCFTAFTLKAQVFIPSDFPYIKPDARPTQALRENKAYLINYFLPQLLDSTARAKLNEAAAFQYNNYQQPLTKFPECIYFNDVLQQTNFPNWRFPLYYDEPFPPSLRFYTDSSKNNVDSLFSMNLYPTIDLENYIKPFYFKKTEVTNAEYSEFVHFVLDSIARRLLSDGFDDYYLLSMDYLCKHGYSIEDDFPDKRYWPLNKKEEVHYYSPDPDYAGELEPLFLPNQERYWRRKQIDTRKINYEYYYDSTGMAYSYSWKWGEKDFKKIFKNVINVYPDTLCWVHDFGFPENEMYSNLYFWHPAFANYPVVGITYEQAKAFLNWKTIEEQKKLDAQGIKLKVQYDLPSEIEWEIAATSEMEDGKISSYGKNYRALADQTWVTDLMLDSTGLVDKKIKVVVDSTVREIVPVHTDSQDDIGVLSPGILYPGVNPPMHYNIADTTLEKDGKKFEIETTFYYWSAARTDFLNADQQKFNPKSSVDSYVFTAPADLQKVKKVAPLYPKNKLDKTTVDNSQILTQLDGTGISFMGGNVSEWLKDDYKNWRAAFLLRLKMLHSIKMPDAQLEYQREFYFDQKNARNGKLVRGGNWFDERYSSVLGKNPAGMNAKCFVDPETDHCTLGFRYVIRVTKK
jgi:formylglycine-generating enzyme required for sulfatase activity